MSDGGSQSTTTAAALNESPNNSLRCRLLFDSPGDGAWNMAVDEALGETAAEQGLVTLRFYTWKQPTLSLGYFQGFAERQGHASSRECAIVRRASGGGAILHDRELTYSLALACPERSIGDAPELYLAAHGALVTTLAEWKITAAVRAAETSSQPVPDSTEQIHPPSEALRTVPGDQPFLCFQRQAAGDVLIEKIKIAGSAQRRRRGALLQHGSVLLKASPFAPELQGIRELTDIPVSASDLARQWAERMAAGMHLSVFSAGLSAEEISRATELSADKYGHGSWTCRR